MPAVPAPARALRVAVVGSGVLGAAAACELAARGASVVICTAEDTRPPVTDVAFGWLTAHGSAAAGTLPDRRRDAVAALDALRRTTDDMPLRGLVAWSGAVSWGAAASETREFVGRAADGVQLVDADALRRLVPGLRGVPEAAASASDEGVVEPDDLRRALLARARSAGATVVGVRVERIEPRPEGGFDVRADRFSVTVDRVVLACGTAIPGLASQLGERLEVHGSPAARFTFAAADLRVDRVVSTPSFEIRPSRRHGFVGAEDVVAGEPEAATRARVRDSLDAVREAFGLRRTPELRTLAVGLRPTPPGGTLCAPLVAAPGVVALAAHPGLSLAASLARRTADLVAAPD